MTTDAESIDPDEHIDPDDPRYDGFRIREMWAMTALAPDNQEAILWVNDPRDAARHHLTPGPAFASDQRRLKHLREYAQEQATRHGIEVRIRHFGPLPDDGEVIAP
jgi:hypothetical protein